MNADSKKIGNQFFLTFLLLTSSFLSLAQTNDSTKTVYHFSGNALVTNNGISFIPTFSLGKPATIINLSMGDKRLSFDPEFRFSLEGKPWSILLWARYKVTNSDRFKFTAGTHLGLSYNFPNVIINGVSTDITQVKRYWAGELVPNYILNKHISVGLYYLYSHGLDGGTTKNTHFLTLNSNITNIPITNEFFVNVKPQVYYLQMDNLDGYYTSATVSLGKKKFPFFVSAIFNQKINSTIVSKDFVWNLSLNYTFNNNYTRK
ncbi:MAG: hypothetical protein WCH78_11340 [Bacteroidota bacterium]